MTIALDNTPNATIDETRSLPVVLNRAIRQVSPSVPRSYRHGGPRVALLVDHPLRDLPGMVLLARYLTSAGATAYLVPFNLAEVELPRLVPDLVLLNYYRRSCLWLYEALAAARIPMAVLDTEGGVLESLDAYTSELVAQPEMRSLVRRYLCWGPVVARHLVDGGWFDTRQVTVTGCPRTDYYASPWREAVARRGDAVSDYGRNLILLNGNFSLGNPGFVGRDDQHRIMVDSLGHEPAKVRQWQDRECAALRELCSLANWIARRYPQATVVYRPHPFESLAPYHELLQRRANLHCVRQGSVEAWLARARVVIQRSCTTAIEAGLAGVPAFSPHWVEPSFERPASDRVSVPFASAVDLVEAVGSALSSEFSMPDRVQQSLSEVVGDWFYAVDGQSHERAAEALLDCATTDDRAERRAACRDLVYRLNEYRSGSPRWIRKRIKAALHLPPNWSYFRFGAKPLQPERFDKWDESSKRFTADDVSRLLAALGGCGTASGTETLCEPAHASGDYSFGYVQGRSLRLGSVRASKAA
jgi:surface carbohydrate biosynthesis protein